MRPRVAIHLLLHAGLSRRFPITRETIIRGLGGTITYTPRNVTVTLDRPGQPRIARALALLLAEINTRPPILPGDGRPITYTQSP